MPIKPNKHKRFFRLSFLLLGMAALLSGCNTTFKGDFDTGFDLHSVNSPYVASALLAENGKDGDDGAGALPSLDDDDDFLDSIDTGSIIADPIEPWNRFWFGFNDILIENVVSPVHKGYRYITPEGMRTGVSNAYRNIKFPIRFVNCLLQGKGREAGVEFSSFMLNTTAGLGGIFDVASSHKKIVEPQNEDGGQTLGVWGVGEGFYIVWPLLGPSNLRDTFGLGIDYFANPLNYMFDSWEVDLAVSGYLIFNGLDETINAYETMKGIAVEPYTAIRDGYTQLRRAEIAR